MNKQEEFTDSIEDDKDRADYYSGIAAIHRAMIDLNRDDRLNAYRKIYFDAGTYPHPFGLRAIIIAAQNSDPVVEDKNVIANTFIDLAKKSTG